LLVLAQTSGKIVLVSCLKLQRCSCRSKASWQLANATFSMTWHMASWQMV
jgi:hypothetical protein